MELFEDVAKPLVKDLIHCKNGEFSFSKKKLQFLLLNYQTKVQFKIEFMELTLFRKYPSQVYF